MAISIIKELLHKSDASGSRSTILKPITWFISSLIVGITILLKFNSPEWLIIFLTITMGLSILVFLFAYIYCLFTDKDAIRSEKYSIQKMAIEKGLYGDNNIGVFIEDKIYQTNESRRISNSEEEN